MKEKQKQGGLGCGIAFATPFALVGVVALVKGVQEATREGFTEAAIAGLGVGAIFTAVGLGMIATLLYGARIATREAELRARHPDEPWRWDVRWQSERVACDGKARQVALWVFAVLWNGISAPTAIGFVLEEGFDTGAPEPYLVMLFPAVGLGLLVAAVRGTWRWLRFGRSELVLATMPGVIGGHLEGHLETRAPLERAEAVELTLSCLERRTRGRGKHRDASERVLWQDVQRLRAPRPGRGTALPFSFTIPADCRSTDGEDHDDRILWRLEAAAALPGIDYAATFELPVFLTEASVDHPEPRSAPDLVVDDAAVDPAAHGIHVRADAGGGLRLDFEAMRNKGAVISLGLFIALWTGAIWLGRHYGAPMIFTVIFVGVELLMVLAWISMAFSTTRVELRHGRLTIRSSTLGIARQQELDTRSIEAVRLEVGMSSQTAGKHTPYWDIEVRPKVGRAVTVGRAVRDKAVARHVADELARALGLPDPDPS